MQLHSLHLENIRSYTKEQLDFPQGLILLSGDIGAGKSTILLAIEFALFGIQRGGIAGSGLLRHGTNQGSVTLNFSLQDQNITIKRNLKRTPKGTTQEAGSITIDDQETSLTANELKVRILELLGYPQDILQRDALYRYTVYTPQEEMKAILSQKPEERLSLLRKLFSIDKYQRVKDNCQELIRDYKAKENHLQGKIEGLTINSSDNEDLKVQKTQKEEQLQKITENLVLLQKAINKSQDDLESHEKARFRLDDLKRQIAILNTRLQDLISRKEDIAKDLVRLQELIAKTQIGLEETTTEQLIELKHKYREFQKKIDEKRSLLLKQQAQHETVIKNSAKLTQDIVILDTCPTCQQQVSSDHKDHITKKARQEESLAKEQLQKLDELALELRKKQDSLNQKNEELLQKERQQEAIKIRLETFRQNKEREKILQETLLGITRELEIKQKELQQKLEEKEQITFNEDIYRELRQEHTTLVQEERSLVITKTTLQKELERVAEKLSDIENRLQEKKRVQQQIELLKERNNWLSKHLLSISGLIERAIFLSIYTLFNDYFRQWLSTLLEDETLSVRLDADFTPIVTQNEHETSIDYLSGGERTSLALAYRLSLNKVINEFLTNFKTKDLLILDEPTDGFSTEQLDRVREVLEQLHMAQIIIVSHEAQMEGYVDHVIRIQKDGHESKIAT